MTGGIGILYNYVLIKKVFLLKYKRDLLGGFKSIYKLIGVTFNSTLAGFIIQGQKNADLQSAGKYFNTNDLDYSWDYKFLKIKCRIINPD